MGLRNTSYTIGLLLFSKYNPCSAIEVDTTTHYIDYNCCALYITSLYEHVLARNISSGAIIILILGSYKITDIVLECATERRGITRLAQCMTDNQPISYQKQERLVTLFYSYNERLDILKAAGSIIKCAV